MLIGVRKPEFLQVPPLTMKILLSGGDRVGSSPKTCFCFSLSSRGLHLHTGDLPSSSKQERHFPLNAVLTAPHASHLPTPKHGLKENSQQPAAKNFKRAMKSVQGCGQVMLYELTFTECLLRAKYCSKCYMNYLS